VSAPTPTRATHLPSHAGRRTAITWWAEAGYDERDVMMWVGHEAPVLTLRLYRQARNRPRDRGRPNQARGTGRARW
jgi:integrase